MRLRLTKLDELQFLTCLKHQLWGSRSARFREWRVGDFLAFIVDKALAGLAEVSGKPFMSRQPVWDNGVFPHRIPLKFTHVILPEHRPPLLGETRDALISAWGTNYGWGILNQQTLTDEAAQKIADAIQSRPNSLSAVMEKFDSYIEQARIQRDLAQKARPKRGRPRRLATTVEKAVTRASPKEESAHSKAQYELIRLGKAVGCLAWIATNDRGKPYRGKKLGEGCLKSLPNMGLSEEAADRISWIDVIWIQQSAPVCAFEIETTTEVFSGLLRLADLLAVVPALRIKLFIVAPKERQDKVMAELARPTFKRIGLSEYCRFISTNDLEALLERAEGLAGHIQPTIVDSVAVEAVEELAGSLE